MGSKSSSASRREGWILVLETSGIRCRDLAGGSATEAGPDRPASGTGRQGFLRAIASARYRVPSPRVDTPSLILSVAPRSVQSRSNDRDFVVFGKFATSFLNSSFLAIFTLGCCKGAAYGLDFARYEKRIGIKATRRIVGVGLISLDGASEAPDNRPKNDGSSVEIAGPSFGHLESHLEV